MKEEKRMLESALSCMNENILKMGGLVEKAIFESVEALKNKDVELAKSVIENDKKINLLELDIIDEGVNILALHQPVAIDLRFITTGMRIATDLERMADLARDLAYRAIDLAPHPLLKPLIDIPKLAIIAQEMTRHVLDAFVNKDTELAKKAYIMDDEADRLRDLVYQEVTAIIAKDGATIDRGLPLLLIARYLERICDHATNIAEEVIYMVEARFVRHHPEEMLREFKKEG